MSVTDPDCHAFGPAQMDWTSFSPAQRTAFEEAYQLQRQSPVEALKKYQLLSQQVQSYQVFYNLGLAQAAAGDLAGAETALKQSAALNPKMRETFKILSLVQKALGKEAESQYNKNRYLQL